jgi:hypothetical protein
MSDTPEFPDLKFLPDWLKESAPATNRYADFEGESVRPQRGDRGDRGPRPSGERRGPRPDGPRGPRPGGERRGPRPDGPRGPRPGGPPRGDKGPRGPKREGGPRHEGRGPREDRGPRPEPIQPAAVKLEFLPEPAAVTAIAKQIKATHRAYALFGTARMFLDKLERHRVRVTSENPEAPLYQIGDGPVALDRAHVERDAFRILKSNYYSEEVQEGEPPKGTFTNVARLRASGLFLGPTNYHSYQPALRRIYEERYARRMSFAEFQAREIEVLKDEQSINDWKEQARRTVTWTTTQEAEPRSFKTLAEVEAHFRSTYLPKELKTGPTFEANGAVVRAPADRALGMALQKAGQAEHAFPQGIVNAMRPVFTDAGLHFFKHRKRIVYVSTVRPLRHPEGQPAKDNVLAILRAIEAAPRCTRQDLARKIIGENFETPEKNDEKTALAGDLHYLLVAGHVIEFSDGKFDLPLPPKAAVTETAEPDVAAETAEAKPAPAAPYESPIIASATPSTTESSDNARTNVPVEPAETAEAKPAVTAPYESPIITSESPSTNESSENAQTNEPVEAPTESGTESTLEAQPDSRPDSTTSPPATV